MKKLLTVLLALAMVLSFAACGGGAEGYDAIPDTMESEDGTYELAFVTDVGSLKDNSFNQFTWNGVKSYASENELSYKYYQPANGNEATDDDRVEAMTAAAEAGAKVVVAAGFLQAAALATAAEAYPDTNFIFVDGWPLADKDGNTLKNVAAVAYQEEQAGYFAGYAAVSEGLTKLGFSGGGGGTNPACIRYGYGFVQGAEAAAEAAGTDVEMRYSWEYGATYSASQDLQAMLNGWYESGTECIFVCGGQMCNSAFAAASANEKYVIGVDVDQSGLSETVITSAMKDLAGSVGQLLGKFYDGEWDSVGGTLTTLGVNENAVGIPTDTWSLENWSVDDYNALLEQVKAGEIVIDNKYTEKEANPAGMDWAHIKFVK